MKWIRNILMGFSYLIFGLIILVILGGVVFYFYINHKEQKFYNSLPKEDWTQTAPGRYAHSLNYEDKLAKPVPYDISSPHFFTSDATKEKRSEEYFEHLCDTEAGNYVWKKAEPQTSIALLRGFEMPTGKVKRDGGPDTGFSLDEYENARDGWEAPVLVNYFYAIEVEEQKYSYGYQNMGMQDYLRFISYYGTPYADYEIWFNGGKIIKYSESDSNKIDNNKIWVKNIKAEDKLTSKYGITWRGFSRPHDREYGIAGGDLIIVDLKTNEVIAVQRNFAKARMKGNSYNWYFPLGCFDLYKNDDSKKLVYPSNANFTQKLQIVSQTENLTAVQMPFIQKVVPGLIKQLNGNYEGRKSSFEIEIKNKENNK